MPTPAPTAVTGVDKVRLTASAFCLDFRTVLFPCLQIPTVHTTAVTIDASKDVGVLVPNVTFGTEFFCQLVYSASSPFFYFCSTALH
jgi:hypothetical protein